VLAGKDLMMHTLEQECGTHLPCVIYTQNTQTTPGAGNIKLLDTLLRLRLAPQHVWAAGVERVAVYNRAAINTCRPHMLLNTPQAL
jgi:hypothetical protein